MGEKSDIVNALSKMTTGSILALILGFQIWINQSNDQQWNERLATIMEEELASQERHNENAKSLGEALVRILEDRNE